MTCEHPRCSSDIFSRCTNHCKKNVCLEHLIEHGDAFLHDFTNLMDRLDKAVTCLAQVTTDTATAITERHQRDISRINRIYDEQQETLRKRLAFAEEANAFVKDKESLLAKSTFAQHDVEQINMYTVEIKNFTINKQDSKPFIPQPLDTLDSKMFQCPLTKPNVFGITSEHKIRFDCDGAYHLKYNIVKHFEYYHRMIPECALRLRNAIVDDRLPPETKLFSNTEVLFNREYRSDCPLTDPTNIYGANATVSTLLHIPCSKKQLTLPSMQNHFHLYHKMRYDVAKKIVDAMKKTPNLSSTMKLLAIFVLHKEGDKKVKILQDEFNLDSFGYFERRSVQPLLVFSARTVTERTAINTRQSVEADQNVNAMVHVYVRSDGLASVIVSDGEYPQRVAHTLLSKVMDDFTSVNPPSTWAGMAEQSGKMASLGETLRKYQNPQEADPLMRLQKDLDDTKDILKNTLVNVLERGEKIDDLVARSNDLSFEAKAFYKTARKTNRCCTLF
ncbi:unnamed protein product [Adineta ricciae]|nr:unnamed protein product [Adineta ricciae]